MELDNLIKKLISKYSFQEVNYIVDDQTPNLEVCFHLKPEHIAKVIEKVNKMNDYIASCANMVTIFDDSFSEDLLLQTSVRCAGNNLLYIRTVTPMLSLLADLIFE